MLRPGSAGGDQSGIQAQLKFRPGAGGGGCPTTGSEQDPRTVLPEGEEDGNFKVCTVLESSQESGKPLPAQTTDSAGGANPLGMEEPS